MILKFLRHTILIFLFLFLFIYSICTRSFFFNQSSFVLIRSRSNRTDAYSTWLSDNSIREVASAQNASFSAGEGGLLGPTYNHSLSFNSSGYLELLNRYGVYRANMSPYDKRLFVQQSYNLLDSSERQEKFLSVVQMLSDLNNTLERTVVFFQMKDVGLCNNLLALASSFIVSRLLNASFHCELSRQSRV